MRDCAWLLLVPWLIAAAGAWVGIIMHACGWMEDTDEKDRN